MNLHRVRAGKYLHWPPKVDSKNRIWLEPGGVVDLDDEYVLITIQGQEQKLEPEDRAAAPTPCAHPRFNKLRQEYYAAKAPPKAPEPPPEDDVSKAIPRPDQRPRKGEEKKHGQASALQGSLPQSNPGQ